MTPPPLPSPPQQFLNALVAPAPSFTAAVFPRCTILSVRAQESELDGMLQPLEGKCFTLLLPQNTTPDPIVFQWCHKGRATIRVDGGRIPQVRDMACWLGLWVVAVCSDTMCTTPTSAQLLSSQGQHPPRRRLRDDLSYVNF